MSWLTGDRLARLLRLSPAPRAAWSLLFFSLISAALFIGPTPAGSSAPNRHSVPSLTVASPRLLSAQEERSGDVAANLATGRVVFCVTKSAIVVGAIAQGGETGSLAPSVVPMRSDRFGVLLGAIEWTTTDSAKPVRLDAELPIIAANATGPPVLKNDKKNADEPSEIEEIGIAMLEKLRPLVSQIHHHLDLGPDEPLVELLLADYVRDYGPEVWQLQFRIQQENLGNDYWVMHALRPAYYQLYPPERGHPRTFIDAQYPQNLPGFGLLERLDSHDPQIEDIRAASPELSLATDTVLAGTSQKALAGPVSDFLRAALPAIAGGGQPVLALLDGEKGFQWTLGPVEKMPPSSTKPAEPGAPSLLKNKPAPQL